MIEAVRAICSRISRSSSKSSVLSSMAGMRFLPEPQLEHGKACRRKKAHDYDPRVQELTFWAYLEIENGLYLRVYFIPKKAQLKRDNCFLFLKIGYIFHGNVSTNVPNVPFLVVREPKKIQNPYILRLKF